MWAPGEVVLGVHEVRNVIRTGGMGLVYRVRHRGWGIDLAVKGELTPRQQKVSLTCIAGDWLATQAPAGSGESRRPPSPTPTTTCSKAS
ncbi:hypothetical protein ACWCQS_13130 [Streptomyces sp. NPDC002076]